MDTTIDDLQDAIAAGRAIREHGPYHVRIGMEGLVFRKVVLAHPVVTGNAILEADEAFPVEEHLLFRITRSGVTEELRPESVVDLRSDGVEKFVVFRSDRAFRFLLDERAFDWGASRISGAIGVPLVIFSVQIDAGWRANPDVETTDWRARRWKTAHRVRREGTAIAVSYPYSSTRSGLTWLRWHDGRFQPYSGHSFLRVSRQVRGLSGRSRLSRSRPRRTTA